MNSAEHKMRREAHKFQRGETENQRRALVAALKFSDKGTPEFQKKYDSAFSTMKIADQLGEKLDGKYIVTPYERGGFSKISIDESKDVLKAKYGAKILKERANDIERNSTKYEGKTDDEIVDIYLKEADAQIVITFQPDNKVSIRINPYGNRAEYYDHICTTAELENEVPVIQHFLKTGEILPQTLEKNTILAIDPADEELADMIGLSEKEKYVRLRMDQEEKDILVDLNSEEKVAEWLPTSKVWAHLNEEEKAVWLPKQPLEGENILD